MRESRLSARFTERVSPGGGNPGPPGPPGTWLSFDTIADLSAFNAAGDVAGTIAWVQSVRDFWEYDPTSPLAPDGITIASATGGGNWIRMQLPNVVWELQTTWHIDPVGGNDESTGLTSLTAIQTRDELLRRVAGYPGRWRIAAGTTVDVYYDDDGAEDVSFDVWTTDVSSKLAIHGARTTILYASTISAHVVVDPATNTRAAVTGTLAGMGALVGDLLVDTTQSLVTWIEADLGGGQVAVSQFTDTTGTGIDDGAANTDAIEVRALRAAGALNLTISGPGAISVTDMAFSAYSVLGSLHEASTIELHTCSFADELDVTGDVKIYNCRTDTGVIVTGRSNDNAYLFAGSYGGTVELLGSNWNISGRASIALMNVGLYPSSSGEIGTGGQGAQSWGQGIVVHAGSSVYVQGSLFGSAAGAVAFAAIDANASLTYDGSTYLPTGTGTQSDASLAGAQVRWANVPRTDTENQCSIRDVTSTADGVQLTWYVSGAGAVTADGSSSGAPVPMQELLRRVSNGSDTWVVPDGASITVTVVADETAAPAYVKLITGNGSNVAIQATPTVLYGPKTVTAHVTCNPATNQAWEVTAAGLTTSWSDADGAGLNLVGQLIENVTTGNFAWVAKDLGAKTARFSQWGTAGGAQNDTLNDGDSWRALQLVKYQATGGIVIRHDGMGVLTLTGLDLGSSASIATGDSDNASAGTNVVRCGNMASSYVGASGETFMSSCGIRTKELQNGALDGLGLCEGTYISGASGFDKDFAATLSGRTMVQGGGINVDPGAVLSLSTAQVFDGTGIDLQQGSGLDIGGELFGSGNATVGVAVGKGGFAVYHSSFGVPTITGNESDASLAGAQVRWANTPRTDIENQCSIRDVNSTADGTQADWNIDAAAGSDVADGTLGHPIQTVAEWVRRMQGIHGVVRLAPGQNNLTIYGALSNLKVRLRTDSNSGLNVVYALSPTVLYSGTINAHVAADPANRVPWSITSNGIAVSWTADGLLYQIIEDTTIGQLFAFAVKDLGAKEARLTQWAQSDGTPVDTPADGDAIKVYDMPVITNVDIVDEGEGFVSIQQINLAGKINLQAGSVANGDGSGIVVQRCIVSGAMRTVGRVEMLNSLVQTNESIRAGSGFTAAAGGTLGTIVTYGDEGTPPATESAATGQRATFESLFMAQNPNPGVSALCGRINAKSFQAYDCPVGIQVEPGATVEAAGGNAFTGQGNTIVVKVISGGKMVYTAVPVATGGANDVTIGGTDMTWAAVDATSGYVEGNLAAIVKRA